MGISPIGVNLTVDQKCQIRTLKTQLDTAAGLMSGQPNRTPKILARDFIERTIDALQLRMTATEFLEKIWEEEEGERYDQEFQTAGSGSTLLEAMGFFHVGSKNGKNKESHTVQAELEDDGEICFC